MCTAVSGNNPRFVDHFVPDDDVSGRLHDLIAEIVERREHARYQPASDAAAIDIEIRPGIDFVRKMLPGTTALAHVLSELPALFSHWRDSSIRRIHNERSLTIRFPVLDPIPRRVDRDAIVAGCKLLRVRFVLAFR